MGKHLTDGEDDALSGLFPTESLFKDPVADICPLYTPVQRIWLPRVRVLRVYGPSSETSKPQLLTAIDCPKP